MLRGEMDMRFAVIDFCESDYGLQMDWMRGCCVRDFLRGGLSSEFCFFFIFFYLRIVMMLGKVNYHKSSNDNYRVL